MMTKARQHWLSKHNTGFCATGKMMQRRQQQRTAKCPRCEECEVEDTEHVLKCQSTEAKEKWNEGMVVLYKYMLDDGTAFDIANAIRDSLQAWYSDEAAPNLETHSPTLQQAITNQKRIGWKNLLEGLPAQGWAEAQEEEFVRFSSKRSGRRWHHS